MENVNPETTLKEFVELLDGRTFKNYKDRVVVVFPEGGSIKESHIPPKPGGNTHPFRR